MVWFIVFFKMKYRRESISKFKVIIVKIVIIWLVKVGGGRGGGMGECV